MREKMKKMLFLMLFLLVLGAANVISQVRIGGNGQPNPAAVLDLNADNTNNGTKGLALPRVSLVDINTPLTGSPTVSGMLVYNASGSLSTGVYYWDDNKWVSVSDGVIGNEITDTIANGGLTRSGAGTAASPYKVGIKTGGVTGNLIADYTISPEKLDTTGVPDGTTLVKSLGSVGFEDRRLRHYHSFVSNARNWPAGKDSLIPLESIGRYGGLLSVIATNAWPGAYTCIQVGPNVHCVKHLDGNYDLYIDMYCGADFIEEARVEL
ncbi:hypothetical protein FACS189451_06820 [Bacteroidia bacterium]|nr:hypothetical protein FACS189451_06820 [Bacteroidia bacterium]